VDCDGATDAAEHHLASDRALRRLGRDVCPGGVPRPPSRPRPTVVADHRTFQRAMSVGGATPEAQFTRHGGRVLAAVGSAGLVAAVSLSPHDTGSAASQLWSPFVLVAGLLLVGLVAEGDGLFRAAGHRLARLAPNGATLFVGATVLVALVTAVLNLDTSVVFLTPVLVHAARSRGHADGAWLYGCLLLSNAGSLLLPGSNLTNLIVTGHVHVAGAAFFDRMAPVWVAAVVVTAAVVGTVERRSLQAGTGAPVPAPPPTVGLGLAAVTVVTILVVVLRSPALPVVAVGAAVVGIRLVTRHEDGRHVAGVLGLPVLVGLFGVAVTLGTLGRSWSGPATLLAHLDAGGTAAVGAAASVLVNNLPAASLLASRLPPRPYALMIGLDIGPNFFVTGSLAWILWLRAARAAGAEPSVARASLLGILSVPLSMGAAVGVLVLTGSH
jgi:arsenical pump membrane protein